MEKPDTRAKKNHQQPLNLFKIEIKSNTESKLLKIHRLLNDVLGKRTIYQDTQFPYPFLSR